MTVIKLNFSLSVNVISVLVLFPLTGVGAEVLSVAAIRENVRAVPQKVTRKVS